MSTQNKVSFAGLLIALGIIYGDIGTSPLYVLNAITSGKKISELLVIGSLSLIIWTLTLQTTLKYVILTLNADNKGEGGIFSLFALVRRRRKWLVIVAMIGGAALLADGIITPPISVSSAVEGLKQVPLLSGISQTTIIYIIIGILSSLFFIQQFGTAFIGRFFGPIMSCWFIMLLTLGLFHATDDLRVFKALNPYYGLELLMIYPKGFYILGGVFLCTTGAEALYSDLGHCGKWNIRYSWVFVKTCLIVTYMGQGAWLLSHYDGQVITEEMISAGFNPFYGVMPGWFLYIGIALATAAAIIASQALISGSFTLISEAMRLNLWPKLRINYPTEAKGQLFIPTVNLLLYAGCVLIVLYFQKAARMEAAYGLAITICMIATSVLFANYLILKRKRRWFIYLYLAVFLTIEFCFLYANIQKFPHGGYVALIVGGALFLVMYIWFKARKIKNRYVEFVRLENYVPIIQQVSKDKTIAKYATHLVYLTSADNQREIEHKIIYSILSRRPKRADIYWLIHVVTVDEPYTSEYKVEHIIPNDIIRVDFRLGFRIEPRVNMLFLKVVEDLVKNKEVNTLCGYERLNLYKTSGDFQFIVMEKYFSEDNDLPFFEKMIMKLHFLLKKIGLSEERGFGLDPGNVTTEKFPLIIAPPAKIQLKRITE
ncbi:KUP/HAK/KT family potassium transporter [Niabella terrae]